VMEILTAYLRENARDWPKDPPPELSSSSVSTEEAGRKSESPVFVSWVNAFFDWRRQQNPIRIDFQAIDTVLVRRSASRRLGETRRKQSLDLRGVRLICSDFQVPSVKTDFTQSNFSESAFISADLKGANLRGANLRGSDLRGSDLRGSDLRESDLRKSDLRGVNLFWTDFRGAKLMESDLRGGSLIEANLTDANLTEANLTEANLFRADLSRASLSRTNLFGAYLKGANLSGANLSDIFLLAEAIGLRQALSLDEAYLPKGWSVTWNNKDEAWDITTPDGPYIDPRERKKPS